MHFENATLCSGHIKFLFEQLVWVGNVLTSFTLLALVNWDSPFTLHFTLPVHCTEPKYLTQGDEFHQGQVPGASKCGISVLSSMASKYFFWI